jgi:DNA repair exonuclease SbcCD ATPase subunit
VAKVVTINESFSVNTEMQAGLSILTSDEWLTLQAFCDMAITENPTTDKAMRGKLNMVDDKVPLGDDFKATVELYRELKGYCETFTDDIKPGTLKLAGDIVQYNRTVETVYPELIALLENYRKTGTVTPEKLKKLAEEWDGKGNPTPEGNEVKEQFKEYIAYLLEDAKKRAQKAAELKNKLTAFSKNLETSKEHFGVHVEDYGNKYADYEGKLKKTKEEAADLQRELDALRKTQKDKEIVLETSPLYLLIPGFGFFVMAGVLIGVGVDYGLKKEELQGKIRKLEETQKKLSAEQNFFNNYSVVLDLTTKTLGDVKAAIKSVGQLEKAWNALTDDMQELVKKLEGAKGRSLDEDWRFAALDLRTAQKTWESLAEQADQYRRFGDAKKAANVDQLFKNVKIA